MNWINKETYQRITQEMEMWPDWKKKVFNEEFAKSDHVKPLSLSQKELKCEI